MYQLLLSSVQPKRFKSENGDAGDWENWNILWLKPQASITRVLMKYTTNTSIPMYLLGLSTWIIKASTTIIIKGNKLK